MRLSISAQSFARGATALALLATNVQHISAQAPPPVRELSAATIKSPVTFGNIFSVREIAGGKVLVNDGVRRRVVMLDATLANATIVLDSISSGGNSYGPRASPLIPFLADSSLFLDGPSLSLVVIDPNGRVAHVMSVPRPNDLRFLAGSLSGVDARGNLLYRVESMNKVLSSNAPTTATQAPVVLQPQDSAPVSRANFDKRSVDTVGFVRLDNGTRTTTTRTADALIMKQMVNPLVTIDEWTVLSDGTIAFVRGHDYHVDLIRPDGSVITGAKLPFDWKRLTDADKQHLIDSARTAIEKSQAPAPAGAKSNASNADGGNEMSAVMAMSVMSRRNAGAGDGVAMSQSLKVPPPIIEFVPLSEIGEYYPPIRAGAVKPDADGNLWILPTTSAQSKAGELVYDVVTNRGALKERVRIPAGRSIAGFGKGGVVYLMFRDAANEWHLERTRVAEVGRQ